MDTQVPISYLSNLGTSISVAISTGYIGFYNIL
jgi:hypothetical protein